MTTRRADVVRNTKETQITASINLDGTGQGQLNTGMPFIDHMLDQIVRHGLIDINITCTGDVEIDDHHSAEDCGITLGQAFAQAIGDKKGIRRVGNSYVSLDEALSRVVIDISGRPHLDFNVEFTRSSVGGFDVDLFYEFFQGFVNHANITVHIDNLRGRNTHHQIESIFKAFARALRMAIELDPRMAGQMPPPKAAYNMTTVAVLDYGMGNLHSVAKALEHVGATKVIVTHDPALVRSADRVVFPGVGAMRDCIAGMKAVGVDEEVREAAKQKPVLAICVGMQALLNHSEENGGVDCLGMFAGNVKFFGNDLVENGERLKVPHMGWNEVQHMVGHALWRDIPQNSRFYFVHSYYVDVADRQLIAGRTHYGLDFTTAIAHDNLFAVQFHPEKSQKMGLQLLKNFVEWTI